MGPIQAIPREGLYRYGTDTSLPWGWTFSFPNGTGYYEFCTRGWAGTDHEDFPSVADCGVHKNTGVFVVTGEASTVGPTEATLHGLLIDDGGEPCQVYFEYGTTASYGNFTGEQMKTTGENFSEAISGLLPATLYHYRAVALNSHSRSNGTDCTFSTLPSMTLTIEKPQQAFYVLNQRLISFPVPLVIGRIEVMVNATSMNSSIDRVEFYIGGTLESSDSSAPYSWMWAKPMLPLKKILTVKAYDVTGYSISQSLVVYKIF